MNLIIQREGHGQALVEPVINSLNRFETSEMEIYKTEGERKSKTVRVNAPKCIFDNKLGYCWPDARDTN